MGTRMKFPGYPSNREADEREKSHCVGLFTFCERLRGKARQ